MTTMTEGTKPVAPSVADLLQLRKAMKLTRAELALRSGVSESSLSRLEKTGGPMRMTTAEKLAAVLDTDPKNLMGAAKAYTEMAKGRPTWEGYYGCIYMDDRSEDPLYSVLWYHRPSIADAPGRFWRISHLTKETEYVPSANILYWMHLDIPPGVVPG